MNIRLWGCCRLVLEDDEYTLMWRLANADRFNDRLVTYFSWKEWVSIDPLLFELHENALIIKERLSQFVRLILFNHEKQRKFTLYAILLQ